MVERPGQNDLATNDTGPFDDVARTNDTLTGGSGADLLRGSNGNDVLDGRGPDALIGDGDGGSATIS
jgi:Ca2+-binding RTX toxin-like protein